MSRKARGGSSPSARTDGKQLHGQWGLGKGRTVATTGDRFEMPDGSVYEVTAAAADSDGRSVG